MKDAVLEFKFAIPLDTNKTYVILETEKHLSKFSTHVLEWLNKSGVFNFDGSLLCEVLGKFLYAEETNFDKLRTSRTQTVLSAFRFTEVGRVDGKALLKYKERSDLLKKEEVSAVSNKGFLKIKKGQYEGLVVKMKKAGDRVSLVTAFLFNKEVDLQIENSLLTPSDVSEEVFYFSRNYSRESLKLDKHEIVIDAGYLLVWSMTNYPDLFSKEKDMYIGSFFGAYFTVLKLSQMFPEYKINVVFGVINWEYLCRFSEFHDYPLEASINGIKIELERNKALLLELCTSVGFGIVDAPMDSKKLFNGVLSYFSRQKSTVIVYSRDYSFLWNSSFTYYFPRSRREDFDRHLSHKDALRVVSAKSFEDIPLVLALDCLSANKCAFGMSLYNKMSRERVLEEFEYISGYSIFLEKVYPNMQKYFHVSGVVALEVKVSTPSVKKLYNLLTSISMYREATVVDLMFPILIGQV